MTCDTYANKQAQLPPLHSGLSTVFMFSASCSSGFVGLPAASGGRRELSVPGSSLKIVSLLSFWIILPEVLVDVTDSVSHSEQRELVSGHTLNFISENTLK